MLTWTPASGGDVPPTAQSVGNEASGEPLFVARQTIPGGGLQIGKVRPGLGGALIPYGGAEESFYSYQVLVNPTTPQAAYIPPGSSGIPNWFNTPQVVLPGFKEGSGFVPPWFPNGANYAELSVGLSNPGNLVLEFHAIKCGYEEDGTPLFCAVVAHQGGFQPGKVRLGLGGANIGFGGSEIAGQNPYTVLCDASYGFFTFSGSYVPVNSSPCGTDDNWDSLYLARCLSGLPGLQIGKARSDGFGGKGASISYGGKEVFVTNYQVLAVGANFNLNWVLASGGAIPDGAVVLGNEADGTPMFGALSTLNSVGSGTQVGKIRHGFQGAYFPYAGNEVSVSEYFVLCAP